MAERLAQDPGEKHFSAKLMAERALAAKESNVLGVVVSLRRQVATEADRGGRSLTFGALHLDVSEWFRRQGFRVRVCDEPGSPPVTRIEW